ncbi:MAG TPA: response regulator transcription factor [Gemmatimonadota bacterium]|jgi:DNA-binding NarL/FixJ family response regulator|nr:response regulator transcription factor [Gemmatimonadota bacterium]
MSIRVAIADDHPVVLEGLASILARTPDVEILSRDLDGHAALEAIRQKAPDVAVLDAVMPGRSGIEILEFVREQGLPTRVVLLAGELGSEDLTESIRLGVDGILMKDEASTVLLDCVKAVAAGGRWVSVQLVERALNIAANGNSSDGGLTPRESEIAEGVASGLQNKEIAEKLGIADGTVRIHVHNIFKKLGIQNRVELANRIHERKSVQST